MSASDVALFVVQACIQFYDNVYADACVSVIFQSDFFNRKLCNAYKAFMDKCGWNGL